MAEERRLQTLHTWHAISFSRWPFRQPFPIADPNLVGSTLSLTGDYSVTLPLFSAETAPVGNDLPKPQRMDTNEPFLQYWTL